MATTFSEETSKEIREFVQLTSRMARQSGRSFGVIPSVAYVAEFGRVYTTGTKPKGKLRQRGLCFRNAAQLAISNPSEYTYVEGYAYTVCIPMEHAWCVNRAGVVVDPTWGLEGKAYFGVPIRLDTLVAALDATQYYGVFGWATWRKVYPILAKENAKKSEKIDCVEQTTLV